MNIDEIPYIEYIRAGELTKAIEIEVLKVSKTTYVVMHKQKVFKISVSKRPFIMKPKVGDRVVLETIILNSAKYNNCTVFNMLPIG